MQASTLMIVLVIVALAQARPQPPSNFMLWNYFPYMQQQQQLQVMQHANIPIMQPHPMQYPTFDMFFNRGIAIANNMPIMGEVQFQVPQVQASAPTRQTRPATTPPQITTTPPPPPAPASSHSPSHKASIKPSTPPVGQVLKSQLSKGIFEMARQIQANILSEDSHYQAGKFNVFSPINVAAVLSLLELGAKGQTSHELRHILGFDKLQPLEGHPLDRHHAFGQMLESLLHPDTNTAQINMANGLFMQKGYSLRQDYHMAVETIYQSQVLTLNFKQQPAVATKFINDWVLQQTNGKITNILGDGIDRSTRTMVASAVYFKALWTCPFVPEATSKRPFYPNGRNGQKIMVDTMVTAGEYMYYESKDYDCRILALPFQGETTTMYIILPNKSNEVKLRKLQTSLTADIIEAMIARMEMRSTIVAMPKMHLSDTLDLKDILGQLKVQSVFESGTSDLSGIIERNRMSIDGFMHKIDLTVNEMGTEAAAATASNLSRQEVEVEFRMDSPFMFVVRHDETRLPIFYGSVFEPVNA